MSHHTHDGKTVVITLPTGNTSNLVVTQNTTVGQIVDILVRMIPEGKDQGEEFGITLHESPEIIFERHTKIIKIPTEKFLFRKTIFHMQVQNEQGKTETFGLDPLLKVKEAILFLESTNFTGCTYSLQHKHTNAHLTPNHELYLLANGKDSENVQVNHCLKLDFDRTLQSYRLKQVDLLVMKTVQAKGLAWKNITGDKEICIIITCPEHQQQKAILFPPSTTYDIVCEKFLSKSNIKESKYFYSLYVTIDTMQELMHPHWNLLSFPLPTPARLECKYKNRVTRNHFGVDPLSLPFVNDNGFHVPEILAIMKDMLILNGLETEGIFRKAGLESEMNTMKDLCNAGKPFHSRNVHSIATMMKRWFKELPKRLFSHLDCSYADDDRCTNISELLTPLEQSLAYWLFDLLLTISDKEEENKMSISNIAIVWGPGMVGTSTSQAQMTNVMDSFNETRLGVELIEKNLSSLKDKRPVPRINLKHLVTIREPEAVVFEENHTNEIKIEEVKEKEPPRITAVCLYDNIAENEGEISVRKGVTVNILDNSNPDWVMISVGDSKGYIPRNYLEFKQTSPTRLKIPINLNLNSPLSPRSNSSPNTLILSPRSISVPSQNTKTTNTPNISNANNSNTNNSPNIKSNSGGVSVNVLKELVGRGFNKKENENVNTNRKTSCPTNSNTSPNKLGKSVPFIEDISKGKSAPTLGGLVKSRSNFTISSSSSNDSLASFGSPKAEDDSQFHRPRSMTGMKPALPPKPSSMSKIAPPIPPPKPPPKPQYMKNQIYS